MTLHTKEQRQAFLDNLEDRRHGTSTGYYIAYCQCEKCSAFREEHNRKKREEAKAKRIRQSSKRKKQPSKSGKDVCTVDEAFRSMMGKPTIIKRYCVVCGSTEGIEQHHIVKRSEGKWVVNGREVEKPTLTLCKTCHMKVHSEGGLLFFRWADATKREYDVQHFPHFGAGWYEFLEISEEEEREWRESHRLPNGELPSRIGYMNALEMEGWERIR